MTPTLSCVLPPEALLGSHSENWGVGGVFSCFWQGEGNSSHFDIGPEHSVILNKACHQEKLCHQSPRDGVLPEPNRPGGKEGPIFIPHQFSFLT